MKFEYENTCKEIFELFKNQMQVFTFSPLILTMVFSLTPKAIINNIDVNIIYMILSFFAFILIFHSIYVYKTLKLLSIYRIHLENVFNKMGESIRYDLEYGTFDRKYLGNPNEINHIMKIIVYAILFGCFLSAPFIYSKMTVAKVCSIVLLLVLVIISIYSIMIDLPKKMQQAQKEFDKKLTDFLDEK